MKNQLLSFLNRKIVSDRTGHALAQVLICAATLFVGALSLRKLVSLDLTEAQLFFGILLCAILTMLMFLIALVIPLASCVQHETSRSEKLKG